MQGFVAGTKIASYTISDRATEIPEYFFCQCHHLKNVGIPDSVRVIRPYAFDGCLRLQSIVIPPGVCDIQDRSFRDCSSLTAIVIPDGVTKVSAGTFQFCTQLRSVVLPQSVTRIESMAFFGCRNLSRIAIPESVTFIGDRAFSGCEGLTSAQIPRGVATIGAGAFACCTQLVVATLPADVAVLTVDDAENGWFSDCHCLQYVIAPSLVGACGLHFSGAPVEWMDGAVDDTPHTRYKASTLRFWTRRTHRLCSPLRRRWVMTVILAGVRLRARGLHLPPEMWIAIVECVQRHELGSECGRDQKS